MIKTVTLLSRAPLKSKAFIKEGLAIVSDSDGFWIYHVSSGLMLTGYPIVGAKNVLDAVREFCSTDIEWEMRNPFQGASKESIQKAEELRTHYRRYAG